MNKAGIAYAIPAFCLIGCRAVYADNLWLLVLGAAVGLSVDDLVGLATLTLLNNRGGTFGMRSLHRLTVGLLVTVSPGDLSFFALSIEPSWRKFRNLLTDDAIYHRSAASSVASGLRYPFGCIGVVRRVYSVALGISDLIAAASSGLTPCINGKRDETKMRSRPHKLVPRLLTLLDVSTDSEHLVDEVGACHLVALGESFNFYEGTLAKSKHNLVENVALRPDLHSPMQPPCPPLPDARKLVELFPEIRATNIESLSDSLATLCELPNKAALHHVESVCRPGQFEELIFNTLLAAQLQLRMTLSRSLQGLEVHLQQVDGDVMPAATALLVEYVFYGWRRVAVLILVICSALASFQEWTAY